jgi:hypothetical protein
MSGERQALYEREGDAFVGTGATRGNWYDNGQSGGAVLALLGHVLEDVPTLAPMSLTRLTVDLVRPLPVGEPIHVATQVVREGKKIQLVELTLSAGQVECTRARALRIRDADLTSLGVPLPPSTTAADPAAVLPPPRDLARVEHRAGVADFLRFGAECRRTTDPIDGCHGLWLRMRVPVVAGEPVRATSRATLPMDCVNLIGVDALPEGVSVVNADVSAHVFRMPRGEWVAMTGHTHFEHRTGHGLSMATMSDRAGVFGVTSTSQILQVLA